MRYAFLGESFTYPIIISNHSRVEEENKLLEMLKVHKKALDWSIDDIKGISPSFCMHKFLIQDDYKTCSEHQYRLNHNIKELFRAKVMMQAQE